ncbi:NAD-dependent protein deacetylase sirtuin-7 [Pangasianodon hypophthalmus]|uniref:NAD-dependent protein deacetylase sirtuin-7 n=1 Tax=Pangasianodon hypophthalmus TaxID=310915 RepID=UPI0023077BBA|nr:NAD-dependent protein deacetylase sirtuin-7 [Pangasianodon hypophthalmus]
MKEVASMESQTEQSGLSRAERKALEKAKLIQKETQRNSFKLVARILKKPECERTEEERTLLQGHQDTVQELSKRQARRNILKRKQEELFDDEEDLRTKVKQLAEAMRQARYVVIYTGAGISTAASIPDYRGPNGVWTQLQKGLAVRHSDLSEAEPTLTHMCIQMLHKVKMVQHVVSQNCDGLHLRSGLPRHALSELHGNMFIEVCVSCTPVREVIRLFDVTERTALHRHATGRWCAQCRGELRDTIVHFGERGTLEQPLNWKGAAEAAEQADLILCLGSSLKVLKKYACLWCMKKTVAKRPKLYIVNLQWTPKDDLATLKIHGKCDDVMRLLMEELGVEIPTYNRSEDPIFSLATPLRLDEEDSHSRKTLAAPAALEYSESDSGSKDEETGVQGGWFGRGYSKARKKRKTT